MGGDTTSSRHRRAVTSIVGAALVLVGVSAAAPGDLDPSFGGDGIVTTSIADGEGNDTATALATYPGGKLVAAGFCECDDAGDEMFALVRYDQDGSLDTSFGDDGRVTTSISRFRESAGAVLVYPDGRLVAAGRGWNRAGGTDFALVRYRPDGSLDPTFGGDGTVTTSISYWDFADALVLQADGKLVAAGGSRKRSSHRKGSFTLARYNADGSLDTSFGGDGIVTTPMSGGSAAALVQQDDGKLVAAGRRWAPQSFALARYNADGSLDTSFGGDGIVTTTPGVGLSDAFALVLQEDGRLVAAGWAHDISSRANFALVRYNADGSLDSSFDGDGKVMTRIGRSGANAAGLVLQPDSRLVAGGKSVGESWSFDFTLARYEPDGSLDTTFGVGGIVTTPIGTGFETVEALVLDDKGKLVAAGYASGPPMPYDFALARYRG